MEFDHLFICVPGRASEAELLIDAGFTEGSQNRHPGQGTANRRFFFSNAFIELLYIDDPGELGSSLTGPTRLKERLSFVDPSVSPFGVCFRPADDQAEPAFKSKVYRPEYLPAHLHVDIADAPLTEPMWFYLSFAGRPDNALPERRETLDHLCGVSEITALTISGPTSGALSDAANIILQTSTGPCVQRNFSDSMLDEHLIEIEFDNHRQQRLQDFRPQLPLLCRW